MSDTPMEITVDEVHDRVERGDESMLLVDCRTVEERAIASIEPSVHVPLDELGKHVDDLADADAEEVVVYCHHGRRSLQAASLLREAGVENARSMRGGIDLWSRTIDPDVPTY